MTYTCICNDGYTGQECESKSTFILANQMTVNKSQTFVYIMLHAIVNLFDEDALMRGIDLFVLSVQSFEKNLINYGKTIQTTTDFTAPPLVWTVPLSDEPVGILCCSADLKGHVSPTE